MQHEVVAISPERCDDKVHPVFHQSADEVYVARQAVQPRDNQRAPGRLRLLQRCRKPRSEQQRIRSRAGLNILVPRPDGKLIARSKGFDLVALRR
jgi:hypothetical protein